MILKQVTLRPFEANLRCCIPIDMFLRDIDPERRNIYKSVHDAGTQIKIQGRSLVTDQQSAHLRFPRYGTLKQRGAAIVNGLTIAENQLY